MHATVLSIQLGNTSVTNVKTSGSITAGAITIPNTDGTSGQVLSTDGSGTLSWTAQSGTGTDDQNISGSGLSGTTLTIGIEGGMMMPRVALVAVTDAAKLFG